MLPARQRLNLRTDFHWVIAGQKSNSNLLGIFYRFSENPQPKIGIAVSAKVFKTAVERNRVKRLLSQVLQQLYSTLKNNLNLLIMPKAGMSTMSSEQVFTEVNKLMVKEKLINV